MSRTPVTDLFHEQAGACARLGSPLYGALLERAAEDIAAGGPCAAAVAGHEGASVREALPLRLLGGVHALALTGRAPELAAHYPSTGGAVDDARPDAAWPAFRAAVADQRAWVREWLTRPPQTNEVGRANLLLAGMLACVPDSQLPVRLFELGSSAGLNLRAEQFRYTAEDFAWGPVDSPVHLGDAWSGELPDWLRAGAARHPALRIVERRGCDRTPLDPLSPDGALTLRAYVWPDQADRAARLDGALRVAAKVPATVEATGAADFLSAVSLEPGTWTVVWHSVMRQYVPEAEWARVERELTRLAAAATPDAGFAYLAFEPRSLGGRQRFCLSLRQGAGRERVLAVARPHGLPAWWPAEGD